MPYLPCLGNARLRLSTLLCFDIVAYGLALSKLAKSRFKNKNLMEVKGLKITVPHMEP